MTNSWHDEGMSPDAVKSNCLNDYTRTYGLIKAKYGPPDMEPSLEERSDHASIQANFTSINGNMISISTSVGFVPFHECRTTVSFSREYGNPF